MQNYGEWMEAQTIHVVCVMYWRYLIKWAKVMPVAKLIT
jgi:hypothetical protein